MTFRWPKIDPLLVLVIAMVILAILLPARGTYADVLSTITDWCIALLFFLYGARLSPQEAWAGLKHWRLHLTILCFTFVVFPIIGLALAPLNWVLAGGLYSGILYLTCSPSTVQSSIAFTSIARGNVAGAIVSASASNLLGVVLTPLLVMTLMSTGSGLHISASVFLEIALQLLLPFCLGQALRRWCAGFAARKGTKIVDRGSIALVVYSAFSAGIVQGMWSVVGWTDIALLILISILLVAFMLWLTRTVARLLHFNRADSIAIQFCGTKKSLATGLPMASIIFGAAHVGIIILPLMLFHQIQLMMCSWLAARYARAYTDSEPIDTESN